MGSDAGEGQRLLEVPRAQRATLLRVELAADERAETCLGDDALRPLGRMVGLGGVRVREVERPPVADVGPPHARDAAAAQADGAARHEAEPRDAAVLLRPVEGELEAEADA